MMLPLLVLVLLQYGSVASQNGGCGDNLVQSLQQCAAAIKNNEPLSVQQEKCSPNGCNYDCPSLNTLAALNETWEARFLALQQMVTNNSAAIASNINELQQVKSEQQTNSAGIAGNTNAIATNVDAITNNTDDITSLDMKVDELHDYCGSTGWTRVAHLDMSDPSQQCPSELRLYDVSGVRACGRQITGGATCDSVFFPSNGTSYSQVCGRIIGYQFGSTDAFDFLRRPVQYTGINNPYVDGVSLTHGYPRHHIWTFVGSINSNGQEPTENYCPCDGSGRITAPDFVGEHYFCESGNPASIGWSSTLYTDDVIWDGKNCGSGEAQCCIAPGIPWFHKVLDSPTTDNIEMRVCGEEGTTNEDTPLSLYEIYIK